MHLPELGKFSDDPESSWTLPGKFYFDPNIYQQELGHIFYKSWQYACHVSVIPQSGDYFVREIGDQSVFVIRDEQGGIQAYHNVCQHRAHRLVEGRGNCGPVIMCPYHNWCYGISGELKSARGSEEVTEFPIQDIYLQAVRVDQLCGFIFVNLDNAARPMSEIYVGLEEEILALSPDAATLMQAHAQNFALNANWKNSVENYSECYHCPNQHPTLSSGALDLNQYRIKVNAGYHRHITTDLGEKQGYKMAETDDAAYHEFGSWFVWPNMVFEVYPGGNLTVFHHVPAGPEQTVQETEWYFPTELPTAAEQEVIDFVNAVREEDIPLCESVQKGLHSQGYTQGRFIVDKGRTYMSEHAVHDFQLRVIRALGL